MSHKLFSRFTFLPKNQVFLVARNFTSESDKSTDKSSEYSGKSSEKINTNTKCGLDLQYYCCCCGDKSKQSAGGKKSDMCAKQVATPAKKNPKIKVTKPLPYAPCCPPIQTPITGSVYDSRKYGHQLPVNIAISEFATLPYIPSGVFRCVQGECLGAGADKCGCYKCPEYFSYHHMSFFDFHRYLSGYRNTQPATGRKP